MPIDENLMIARAQSGDRAALNELVVVYWPSIYRLALSKTGSPEDAQEIAQDTFVRALGALPRYQETSAAFKTYLSRIALNLITDYYRKRGRNPQMVDIAEYNLPLIATGTQPDEAVLDSERRGEVNRLLGLLPEEQRRVIELRILQGVAVADVARILGKSGAAVKMLQQRALKRLKALCDQHGLTERGGE
ncbi:RNA polymerase sigma factor [Sporomusa acidovorans]|uniref:RNA polymerase sigma factor n=1 Tax=Sporomusa acidovorans (strain ATCC 49682 / DSM 3132 / Mol) TaxID=1123286 RepID=A0ABZ3J8M7_SPOA4|nr:RNA polymerase sigma factor [Sporomusa acidovorans]OZC21209.1 ECF RNA polymerase sigma factor SigD [Sporomusa acidovorans DSM 3132]SDE64802.1 RNA polymerase sigma-70 factor, ECF subfamily [Sporomusa acidovorans]